MEDQFEGTTSKANFNSRLLWLQKQNAFFNYSWTEEYMIKTVKEYYEMEKQQKLINCVNCWNRKEDESVALWKIYSDFSKGIMVKSSISMLEKSIEGAAEKIRLSEIKYIDYDIEIMPDGNTMFPLIHKQNAYSYEEEVRLIYGVDSWNDADKIKDGIYIRTDINELIDEIIISPFSPKWFLELVQDITHKYNLDKVIKKSKLSLID